MFVTMTIVVIIIYRITGIGLDDNTYRCIRIVGQPNIISRWHAHYPRNTLRYFAESLQVNGEHAVFKHKLSLALPSACAVSKIHLSDSTLNYILSIFVYRVLH